ncbi:MAG: universal stress protein [Acidimicrobiales bacterium]
MAGIDGSPASVRALEWAAHQAEFTRASLEIVASWEWPTSYGWTIIPDGFDPGDELKKILEPIVSTLQSAHPDLEMSLKLVEGHPAPVLIRESVGADLLVVGSRGHGEFIGMLIGSTSEHCVTNAHCPVVVVRDAA